MMFGFMREQWIFTKGVREIVMLAEQDGFLLASKRENIIANILEFSRDLGTYNKNLSAHQQVMIVTMAFFGVGLGDLAFTDAMGWASQYAANHKQRGELASCVLTASDLMARIK